MSENDPHIHVELSVIHAEAATRDILAATFGLAGDLPSEVSTGCGVQVPYAMTSSRPENVTCLACREYAHGLHLRYAEQVERLSSLPGSALTAEQAHLAAAKHRELANRFSGAGR